MDDWDEGTSGRNEGEKGRVGEGATATQEICVLVEGVEGFLIVERPPVPAFVEGQVKGYLKFRLERSSL